MLHCSVYATDIWRLDEQYEEIVAACHAQGISRISIFAAGTGKIMGHPERHREYIRRLSRDGLSVFAIALGLGHPAMGEHYNPDGTPPDPPHFWRGGLIVEERLPDSSLLPLGWQYAVNEFGNPVYSNACVNEACIQGNRWVMEQLAPIYDEIWFDDDFRNDSDQGAGAPHTSTAACYCDRCLAELSARLGRKVTREDVLADQAVHDAWIAQKVEKLAALWRAICEAGRAIKPHLRMGMMVRWSGEERDGVDIDRWLPAFGERPLLRVGEGHFTRREYVQPQSQAMEYLVASYHVSWFPPSVSAWSETTYFSGVTRQDIRKKVALALGAGAKEVAYCPCVPGWVLEQNFLAEDRLEMERWAAVLGDAGRHYQPIAILRTPAAGRGDRRPTQRVRDRQIFPLFSMAGLFAVAVRQGHWRDTGEQPVLAVTGRSAWDFNLADLGERELVVDGAALVEDAPLNAQLGIGAVRVGEGGEVHLNGEGYRADGLLFTKGNVTIIPYIWQDVPESLMPRLLEDIRRVVGPKVGSVVVEGDTQVLPVHVRHDGYDAILLVNLTHEPRRVRLEIKDRRRELLDADGRPLGAELRLEADEIKLVLAREAGWARPRGS